MLYELRTMKFRNVRAFDSEVGFEAGVEIVIGDDRVA